MTTSTYTTLYLQTNAASRERLAVGLLMVENSGQRAHFAYSQRKLSLGRQLCSKDRLRDVRWGLENLARLVNRMVPEELPFPDIGLASPLTARYLSYLHRYQQNLLQYGEPVAIDLPCTNANFEFLYQEQVDDEPEPAPVSEQRRQLLALPEREVLRARFNQNVRVDRRVDQRIDVPVRVSLLGKNGVGYYGKIIDPFRPIQFIDTDTSSFYALTVQTKGSKHYAISREPDALLYPKQHKAWDTLRNIRQITYLDVSEIGLLEAEAEQNGVHKLFGDEEE